MVEYIVLSTAVTDEIRLPSGEIKTDIAGGAGIYALAGIKLWADSVMIVTGVGADYLDKYGKWYRQNNLSQKGLIVKDPYTPHTTVEYFSDGEREETPKYGPDHYKKIEPTPEDLLNFCKGTKAVYVFKNANKVFWDKIIEIKNSKQLKVMWEIAADATTPGNLSLIKDIAKRIDIFSINKTESLNMLDVETIEEVAEEFTKWGVPLIFLRDGKRGAYMITPHEVCKIPSVSNLELVDSTGGGNSSSGAVLYGFCEGYPLEEIGLMGSISAAECLKQYGVPEILDQTTRQAAKELKGKMLKAYRRQTDEK